MHLVTNPSFSSPLISPLLLSPLHSLLYPLSSETLESQWLVATLELICTMDIFAAQSRCESAAGLEPLLGEEVRSVREKWGRFEF
jgi:hypothetical protein